MSDHAYAELLRWAAPLLGLRAEGFENVGRQVCRRIAARARDLGLDADGYRLRVASSAEERRVLDTLCFVTISRFYRDAAIWDALRAGAASELAERATARGARSFRVWSAGCASGEEPYTFAILWHAELAPRFVGRGLPTLEVIATDRDQAVLTRAARGLYERGSLRELPRDWQAQAFVREGERFAIAERYREGIRFEQRDVRDKAPDGPLDIAMCRNVAFTYFDRDAQEALVTTIADRLVPRGLLVTGLRERVPDPASRFEAIAPGMWRLVSGP